MKIGIFTDAYNPVTSRCCYINKYVRTRNEKTWT